MTTTTTLPRSLRRQIQKHQQSSVAFFEDVLGINTLEDYQRRVIETVDANERTAISACHDVGKSFLMARIAIAFLSKYPNSKVITTAPTYNQVERILWSELRSAHAKARMPLGGKLNTTDWTFSPDWFAIGFTPKNEVTGGEGQGTQSSFQGFHAEHLLVIFDEATGIPPNIWTMAEGLLASAHVKFVAIGNPTSRNSEFFKCFKSPSWAKVYLSCFDSPNLKANNINSVEDLAREIDKVRAMNDIEAQAYLKAYKVEKPYLLTAKWVVTNAMKWGLNHPLTVSKVLGRFPEEGDNTLVPLNRVEKAQQRKHTPLAHDRKIIGIDVARFGSDSSVLTGMHGRQQTKLKAVSKFDTVAVAGEAIAMSDEIGGADIIVVDETGLGAGVVDLLRAALADGRLPRDCEIRGVQFGAGVECDGAEDCEHKSCQKARFRDMKARIFGHLADDLKHETGLALLDESVYLEELPTILYKYDQKGRMVIESKDEYKKRTGRSSPDHADSLALANFGRYDSLNVGSFGDIFNQTGPAPMASGFMKTKKW